MGRCTSAETEILITASSSSPFLEFTDKSLLVDDVATSAVVILSMQRSDGGNMCNL
jgi:hypothetical protein